MTAGTWRVALASPHTALQLGFPDIFGPDETLWHQQVGRLTRAMECYLAHYGDEPVRVFRAPGRINLRGMHVDTHGGYLNLMTHQRDVLVVAGRGKAALTQAANTDSDFQPLRIARHDLPTWADGEDWAAFLDSDGVHRHVSSQTGSWANYIEGSWLRAAMALGQREMGGLNLVVDSTLPRGASLSSSAALCLALLQSWTGWYGQPLHKDALILAAQDAEWFTGSRCGTCDQTAIVSGTQGTILHGALDPRAFDTTGMVPIPFPAALSVLVINSHTRRSLSGIEKVAYTTNRFAYSMAMAILQQTLARLGYEEEVIAQSDVLSRITPERLGGEGAVYRILKEIPESLTLDALRTGYVLPDLDHEYERYFGDVDRAHRPTSIALRGPLLFGIAESARAHQFAKAIQEENFVYAGQLMTWGHDGDRRITGDGLPAIQPVGDAYLDGMMKQNGPIVACPGAYGASIPALDTLVDRSLALGALGASLTGAGMAGTVLALCKKEAAETIRTGLVDYMSGSAYAEIAHLPAPLSDGALEDAVVVNRSVAGAGELRLEM